MHAAVYESERYLNEYLLFHYGTPDEVIPWEAGPRDAVGFPARCVSECLALEKLPAKARALDLGCAVGRSSFELARHCAEVVGIDVSRAFIRAAIELRNHGVIHFDRIEEGLLSTRCAARVPTDIDRKRVHFEPGDVQKLRQDLGQFDVVLMANLLCRLQEPRALLGRLPSLLRPGGQCILVSPYSWSVEFAPHRNWLGGFEEDGHRVEGWDTVRHLLEPGFDLLHVRELPLLIREHSRKYQWGVSQGSTWVRKAAPEPA